MKIFLLVAGAAVAFLSAESASAQDRSFFGVEAATDESRRGLSWTGGRATVSADASVTIAGLEGTARVVALRDSPRHFGSEAVADIGLGSRWNVAGFDLSARATGHLFMGGSRNLDYVDLTASAGYSYGPLYIDAGATYTPSQDAIGGSNLYLFAGANAGIPATPFTISAGIGHSSGDSDGDVRAYRLRPAGDYMDWRIGIEHVSGPLILGVDYVGTDIDQDRIAPAAADIRHSGDRLTARARLSL